MIRSDQVTWCCTCRWFDLSFPSFSREAAEVFSLVLCSRWRLVGLWGRFCCLGRGWMEEGGSPSSPRGEEWLAWRNNSSRSYYRSSSVVLIPHYSVVTVEVPQQFVVSGGTAACAALLSQTVSVNVPSSSHQNFLSSSCQPAETHTDVDRCGQCAETDEQKLQRIRHS